MKVMCLLSMKVAALLVFVTPAVGEQFSGSTEYAAVNAAIIHNHVLPRYERLAVSTTRFADTSSESCVESTLTIPGEPRAVFQDIM